ncbi:MAG: hypothetical protein EI684_13220 [Candidatus Viridilinea halotolerans]|uniref:Uncharacterized protein n=1 Tax=Candidatus Viridilinea halotolerans TaxID=2491704 RepID=A0A426TXM2_9CHLR|nr:MAG: hypothetical protein EI684_13220 [Candidatus Viridilinea halotolerans]
MKPHYRRFFALGFSLVLAMVLGGFAYNSAAQNRGGELFVLGPTTASCDRTGQVATAGYQDAELGLVLRNFWDNEGVFISITFPDGRTFSPRVADGRVLPPQGLDGLIDMPANFPWFTPTSNGGDYYFTMRASNRWPYGSYLFTARGRASNRQTQGCFVLVPRVDPAPAASPATLIVEDNTTGDRSGLHGATVNIFGRGFRGQERITVWITAPDGTVLPYPDQFTSDVGSFASTFVFDSRFPTGEYAFTARGWASNYQVITRFRLSPQTSTPTGWAQLRVAWRANETANQNQEFELQGQFFDPLEQIRIWATLPDNSIRDLPLQQANTFGEFFAVIALDQRLPVGTYSFTARGLNSGRLVIDQVNVTQGSPNITNFNPSANPAPQVVGNNSNAPGSFGGVPMNPNINTLDPAPEFRPDRQVPVTLPPAVPSGPRF